MNVLLRKLLNPRKLEQYLLYNYILTIR